MGASSRCSQLWFDARFAALARRIENNAKLASIAAGAFNGLAVKDLYGDSPAATCWPLPAVCRLHYSPTRLPMCRGCGSILGVGVCRAHISRGIHVFLRVRHLELSTNFPRLVGGVLSGLSASGDV